MATEALDKRKKKAKTRMANMIRCEYKSADVKGVLNHFEQDHASLVRPSERPETSPELIHECLSRVEIALHQGNEMAAISAIRHAFATGLCKAEPHDPRDIPNDEPLASTSLGGGPDQDDHGQGVRLVEMLERYDIRTVGDVRSRGYLGLLKIPYINKGNARRIAEAVGISPVVAPSRS